MVGGFLRLYEDRGTYDSLAGQTRSITEDFRSLSTLIASINSGITIFLCLVVFNSCVFSLIDNVRKKWNIPWLAPVALFYEVLAIGFTILCALKVETRVMSFCWQNGMAKTLIGGIPFIDWVMAIGFILIFLFSVYPIYKKGCL